MVEGDCSVVGEICSVLEVGLGCGGGGGVE